MPGNCPHLRFAMHKKCSAQPRGFSASTPCRGDNAREVTRRFIVTLILPVLEKTRRDASGHTRNSPVSSHPGKLRVTQMKTCHPEQSPVGAQSKDPQFHNICTNTSTPSFAQQKVGKAKPQPDPSRITQPAIATQPQPQPVINQQLSPEPHENYA